MPSGPVTLSVRAPVDGATKVGAPISQKQSAKAVAEKPGGGGSDWVVHVRPPSPVQRGRSESRRPEVGLRSK